MRICDICQTPISDSVHLKRVRCSKECQMEAARIATKVWNSANKERRAAARKGVVPFLSSCPVCGENVLTTGRRKYCSDDCAKKQAVVRSRIWLEENPDRYKETQSLYTERHKTFNIRSKHNLSTEGFENMLSQQNYCCASCENEFDLGALHKIHVDHDHKCCNDKASCGKCIRGLLCSQCNTAAGLMKDDPVKLRLLASYLEKYETREGTYISSKYI